MSERAGAVLCGGRSRRMGTDKAFVEIEGVPMVERVAIALEAGRCEPVVLVGGDAVLLSRFGRAAITDDFPGQGPVGGLVTALRSVEAAVVVVASCDLPALDGSTVAAVAAALDDGGPDAAVAVTDRWQLSLTAWRSSAAPVVAAAWGSGVRSLHELVAAVAHVAVAVAPDRLRNVNTPDELADADRATR